MAAIDIRDYKMDFIKDIISVPDIVKNIDSQNPAADIEAPDSLVYKNIFPYLRIPDSQNKADTYILLSVDLLNINRKNPAFLDLRLTIWAMAHQECMQMEESESTRIDYLGEALRNLFDGEKKYGFGVLELNSSREIILNERYQYRELIFHTVDLKLSSERKVIGR